MTPQLIEVLNQAKANQKSIKEFFSKLKSRKIKNLDSIFHELHDEVFAEISCLDCASCCSSISPIVTDNDIARVSKHLRIKPSKLVNDHLHLDHEHDYVFKQTPCPFLMADKCCSIYEVRPRACREYPHTDRSNIHQILNLTYKNVFVCPAVALIVDRLKKQIG